MYSRVVIVGGGQAAVQAIDTLRRKGFTGKVVLIGDEPWLPYQRPPLSKKYLAGTLERERLLLRPQHFYESHSIETWLGVASRRSPVATASAARRRARTSHTTLC